MRNRLLFGLLALILVITLASCSAAPAETGGEEKGEDLSLLTAAELYGRAADATALLPTARWTTTVSDGAESYTLETLRIREGYDRFSFSQTKDGTDRGVYFNGDRAWLFSEDGAYTAPATTVTFQSFWDSEGFPTGSLSMEHFSTVQRSGMTVTYADGDEAALAAFAALFDGEVSAVAGTATITEDLFIETEEIFVTGALSDGTERQITLKTTLTAHDEKDLTLAVPEGPVMELNDIRLPGILSRGWESLNADSELTLILEAEAAGPEARCFRFSDGSLQRVGGDYSLQENVYTGGPGEESAQLLIQTLAQGNSLRRVTYDKAAEGAVLEDVTEDRAVADLLSGFLPDRFSLASADLTEETQNYSVAITLTQEEARRLAAQVLSQFALEAGDLQAESLSATGTVAIRKSDGAVVSFSCDITGATSAGFTVTRRISFTVETEGVALVPIAPPVYLVDEDGHD